MARTKRTIFVLIPFLLKLASLIHTIVVFTGNTSTSAPSSHLYFLKVNTEGFQRGHSPAMPPVADWYTIGLWNYCSGNVGSSTPTYCSKPHALFWFNPVQVWHLRHSPLTPFVPGDLSSALGTYESVSKWLFCAYAVAIGTSVAVLIVSIMAFWRRLGSVITSLVSFVSAGFSLGASITASVLYPALIGFIKTKLAGSGLEANLGGTMFALTWVATGLSIAAHLFFLATSCCCAVESREEKYEKVPSPFRAPSPAPPFVAETGYHRSGKEPNSETIPLNQYQYTQPGYLQPGYYAHDQGL